jgi:WD40 repeat protein
MMNNLYQAQQSELYCGHTFLQPTEGYHTSFPHTSEPRSVLTDIVFWAMRTSFDYRSMPIYDAAFSPDATILALAHGESVTLWDVDTNSLLQAFDAGIVASRVILAGSEGRYLVASGERGVCVWDLLSCESEFFKTLRVRC